MRDGFTDISGCFDYYYSVSTEVSEQARKVGIFVDKEGYGGVFEKLCLRSLLNIREYVWIVC